MCGGGGGGVAGHQVHSHVLGSLDEAQLKVSLEDLLQADKQGIPSLLLAPPSLTPPCPLCGHVTGRWWVVGSAWTGRDTNACRPEGVATGVGVGSESWVMELARKQRMNTDVRKTVFTIIMTSEASEHVHACVYDKVSLLTLCCRIMWTDSRS